MPRGVFFVLLVFFVVFSFAKQWDRLNPIKVPNGSHLRRDTNGVWITEPSGNTTFVESEPEVTPLSKFPDNGWITSVWTFSPYTFYQAIWKVPPTPKTDDGQILFFFNSFENSAMNDILQPVLQYNNGVAGWTMSSWYGGGGKYYESSTFQVQPGDTIMGQITFNGTAWAVLGVVNGLIRTKITVSLQAEGPQANAQWVLEAYNIKSCAMYPPSNSITAYEIYLAENGKEVYPSWQVDVYKNSCDAKAAGQWDNATLWWDS